MDYTHHYPEGSPSLDKRGLGIHSRAESKYYVPETGKADPVANILSVPLVISLNLGYALAHGLLTPFKALQKQKKTAGQAPSAPQIPLPHMILPSIGGLPEFPLPKTEVFASESLEEFGSTGAASSQSEEIEKF
jgi:hypothetical protein